MERTRLIDEATFAKLRMTPEEASAVVELWAIQNRIAYDPHGVANSVPAGLVIPQQDVRQYLSELRGQSSRKLRPARSIGADARLAAIAAMVLLVAALGFAFAFGWGRRASYPSYVYGPMYRVGATTLVNGLRRTHYQNSDNDSWLSERSSLPVHFVFANGPYFFEPVGTKVEAEFDSLKRALNTVVGGPLAENSRLSPEPITSDQASRALARRSQGVSEYGGPPEVSDGLIDWQPIKVAFGGKITEATVPYARFSDKALRDVVQKEQSRVIDRLAESALALVGPPEPAESGIAVPRAAPGGRPRPGIR